MATNGPNGYKRVFVDGRRLLRRDLFGGAGPRHWKTFGGAGGVSGDLGMVPFRQNQKKKKKKKEKEKEKQRAVRGAAKGHGKGKDMFSTFASPCQRQRV